MNPNRQPDGQHTVTLHNLFEIDFALTELGLYVDVVPEFAADCNNMEAVKAAGDHQATLSHRGSAVVIAAFARDAGINNRAKYVINHFVRIPENPFHRQPVMAN